MMINFIKDSIHLVAVIFFATILVSSELSSSTSYKGGLIRLTRQTSTGNGERTENVMERAQQSMMQPQYMNGMQDWNYNRGWNMNSMGPKWKNIDFPGRQVQQSQMPDCYPKRGYVQRWSYPAMNRINSNGGMNGRTGPWNNMNMNGLDRRNGMDGMNDVNQGSPSWYPGRGMMNTLNRMIPSGNSSLTNILKGTLPNSILRNLPQGGSRDNSSSEDNNSNNVLKDVTILTTTTMSSVA